MGKEFFDPLAGIVGELSLGNGGDDLMTFAAPRVSGRGTEEPINPTRSDTNDVRKLRDQWDDIERGLQLPSSGRSLSTTALPTPASQC